MPLEYEVYNLTLEPYIGATVCADHDDAHRLAGKLEAKSGLNWFVREVEKGKRPIPPQADIPTPVTVDEVRKLMALHGQDCLVTCAWNSKNGVVNIATAGSDSLYAEMAYKLGQDITVIAGCDPKQMTTHEDRRHEHLHVPAPGQDDLPQQNAGA